MIQRLFMLAAFLAFATTWPSLSAGQVAGVYFSPNGGIAPAIVAEINNASRSIDVAAYQLSYPPLIAALRAAALRGIAVRVVIDRQHEVTPPSGLAELPAAGVGLRADAREKIHHNKYAVIDGRRLLTGSFNWTKNAELKNAENLLIIEDPNAAAAYATNFQIHWNHSTVFKTRPPKSRTAAAPAFSPLPLPDTPTHKEPLRWHASLVH